MKSDSRRSKARSRQTSIRDTIRRSLKHPLPRVDLKLFSDPLLRQIAKASETAWLRFEKSKKAILSDRALDKGQACERWSAAFDRWLRDHEAIRPFENRQRRREMAMMRRAQAK